MKLSRALLLPLLLLATAAPIGCGGGDTSGSSAGGTSNGGGGSAPTGGTGGSTDTNPTGGAGATTTTTSDGGTTSTTDTGTTSTTSSSTDVLDPAKDGPYQTTTKDGTFNANNASVPVHAVYPTSGPEAGPYPVIVIAHGFQLPASQYYKYAERLATFGYVALAVDFPTSLFSADNPGNAAQLVASLDWAKTNLSGIANSDLAGITGHSLGGKLSLLAVTKDPRFKASIVLDPVDGGGFMCSPPGCVDVSSLMPQINVPTGFLGETTDAMGSGFGQACAPSADNFQTFYAGANSPSFAVTIKGANHMSFLDDVASCGFTCNVCNMATLDNATVNGMSRAYVVAFYERHLRNNTGYDTYLTGAKAQELYVTPGTATIESK